MTTNNHPAHGPVSLDRLHQIRETLSKAAAQSDGGNLGYAMADAVKVINVAIVSFDAEPVAWECGENIILFNPDTVEAYAKRAEISPKPLYATPPVQETGVYKDMLNIIGLLENNEWAEHCTSTVLGSLLESEITRLVGKEQPVPVVTFYRDGVEAAAKWIDQQREAYDSEHGWSDPDTGAFEFGNDAQRGYSSTLEELAEGIRALHPNAGNSPVIPDGYALVPVEPTDEMIAAAMECDDVVFDSKDPTAFCVQYREIYCAMVDTAPKPELTSE